VRGSMNEANSQRTPKHLRAVEAERTLRASDLRGELRALSDQAAALGTEIYRLTREIERAACSP
jgi:hypothetical protein